MLGPARRQGDSFLCDAGCRRQRQGDHDARGVAGDVGEGARHDCRQPCFASVAAGVDRRAGAALRLLPERDDDPGRRSALDDQEPDRRSDPHGDERAPVPLRYLSTHPDRDQAGSRGDGEGRQVAMTGFVHERELSRKTLLKGGGALLITFSTLGATLGAKAASAAGNGPFDSFGPYDSQQLDSWIAVHADNTASIKLGMIELGQGSTTGLLMIAAEELNMDLGQLKMIANDPNLPPNQGGTYGSQAVHVGGK